MGESQEVMEQRIRYKCLLDEPGIRRLLPVPQIREIVPEARILQIPVLCQICAR
jgi:hypothetical protein